MHAHIALTHFVQVYNTLNDKVNVMKLQNKNIEFCAPL